MRWGNKNWNQHITRGYNIVADCWARANNPLLHTLAPTHTLSLNYKMRILNSSLFLLMNTLKTDQWIDGSTDGQSILNLEPLVRN